LANPYGRFSGDHLWPVLTDRRGDEHSRECLLVRAERRWSSAKVIEALADVMVVKGVPEHLRSDNGPEFVARDLRH
jgi:hypothetical protein